MQLDGSIYQFFTIIVFSICAILLLIKRKDIDSSQQRTFFLGLVGFFLGWSFCQLMFYFSSFYLTDLSLYLILYKAAYIFGICGIIALIFVIERYAVPKTKFIFTLITIIGLFLVIILPMPAGDEIAGARLASYITLPAGVASILLLYIYLVFKLTDRLRRETIWILLGFLLLFLGYVLTTSLFGWLALLYDPYWTLMSFSLMMGGSLILTLTYYQKEI
ncbi:MAG: hypothetical protein ACTSQI_07635 [Candidatus Helarchaeota archaeon]